MLYACVERFDVIDERGNILGWDGKVNKATVSKSMDGSIRGVDGATAAIFRLRQHSWSE
jgi:hypothetical protein